MKNKLLFCVVIILFIVNISIVDKKEEINNIENNNKILVHLNDDNKEIVLDFNEYLIGVVGMEMPASFNIEALKAQAIASRTFALQKLNGTDIYTTKIEQSYANIDTLKEKWKDKYNEYYDKISSAVYQTENIVIKYDNKLIKSYYFSMSNGKTENVSEVFSEELPYLVSVDSNFDESQKNFEVTTTFTKENFCLILNINDCENIIIDNVIRDESNRVSSIIINNKSFSGIDIRKLLQLRSTDFDIIINDNIKIITKGYGHGVGMSQYGANYLASIGYKYEDIIKYYYKNVEINLY